MTNTPVPFSPVQHNGLGDISLERAQGFLDTLEAVNLDEVVAEPVRVTLREYKTVVGDDGVERRVRTVRSADIDTFVPMKLFNRMLASRQKVMKERERFLKNNEDEDAHDPMITWMVEQVLTIWKLSEPQMTREKLEDGLDFTKISKLFTLFFADLLARTRKGGV